MPESAEVMQRQKSDMDRKQTDDMAQRKKDDHGKQSDGKQSDEMTRQKSDYDRKKGDQMDQRQKSDYERNGKQSDDMTRQKSDYDRKQSDRDYDRKQSDRDHDRQQSDRDHDRKQSDRDHDRKQSDRDYDRKQSDRDHDRKQSDRDHDRKQSDRDHDRKQSDRDYDRKQSDRDYDRKQSDRDYDRKQSDRDHDRKQSDRDHDRKHSGETEQRKKFEYGGKHSDEMEGRRKFDYGGKQSGEAAEQIQRKKFDHEGKEIRFELASPPPSAVRAEYVVEHFENGKEEIIQKKFVVDEKLAAQMWNELECPICRDHFTTPRVLPCLHVYCEACLAQAAGSNSCVVCPICRKEVGLPNGDVRNLPKHNMIENLIRILTLNKEKETKSCDGCGNCGAHYWCVEAEEAYCKDCKSIYSSLKYTKDHHIYNFDELIKDRSLQANHRIQLCQKHPKETLRLYCETTNECVCRDCTLTEYKNMKVKPISEIIGQHKDNVQVALDAVQSKIRPLNQSIAILKDEENEMKEQAKKAQNDIVAMIARVLECVKARERHLLNTVEQMKRASVSQLEAKREELTVAMQSTKAGCDFVANLMADGSDVDVLAMEAQIYERMEELKNVDLDIGVKRKNIEFQKVNETIITTFIDGLGKFVVETYNAQPIKEMRSGAGSSRLPTGSQTGGRPISPGEFSTIKSAIDGDDLRERQQESGDITDHWVGKGVRAIGAPNCKSGTGVAEFKKPMGIDFDKSGNMYCADTENNRVQVLKKSGTFSHLIGSGKQGSSKGELCNPTDCCVDNQGFLYVVDSGNNRLAVFTTQGKFIRTIGREGKAEAEFMNPRKICCTKDNYLLITDSDNNRVQIFDPRGNFLRVVGGSDNAPEGQLKQPVGIACDSHGLIYVTQMKPASIKVFAFDGGYIGQFGKEGKGKGELLGPSDVTVDAQGGIIVSEWGNCRVSIFDERGHYHGKYGKRGTKYGEFDGPCCVELNQEGRLVVVDTWNHRIQIL